LTLRCPIVGVIRIMVAWFMRQRRRFAAKQESNAAIHISPKAIALVTYIVMAATAAPLGSPQECCIVCS
jgi:hypothetical protein